MDNLPGGRAAKPRLNVTGVGTVPAMIVAVGREGLPAMPTTSGIERTVAAQRVLRMFRPPRPAAGVTAKFSGPATPGLCNHAAAVGAATGVRTVRIRLPAFGFQICVQPVPLAVIPHGVPVQPDSGGNGAVSRSLLPRLADQSLLRRSDLYISHGKFAFPKWP